MLSFGDKNVFVSGNKQSYIGIGNFSHFSPSPSLNSSYMSSSDCSISVITLKTLSSNLFFTTKQSLSARYELHSRVPVSHQPTSREITAEILIFKQLFRECQLTLDHKWQILQLFECKWATVEELISLLCDITSINSGTPCGSSVSGASGPPGFAATAITGQSLNLANRK